MQNLLLDRIVWFLRNVDFGEGAVAKPGRHEVPGSATLFDALTAAGGVDKLGSLRDIRLIRSGAARPIDFYGLLQGIDGTDPALRDGDRIVVPPIGPTIAIAGQQRLPALPLGLHQGQHLALAGPADLERLEGHQQAADRRPRPAGAAGQQGHAPEIAGEHFDDEAGFPERVGVQDVGRLAIDFAAQVHS